MKATNVLSMEQNLVLAPLQDLRKYAYCVVRKRDIAVEEETKLFPQPYLGSLPKFNVEAMKQAETFYPP